MRPIYRKGWLFFFTRDTFIRYAAPVLGNSKSTSTPSVGLSTASELLPVPLIGDSKEEKDPGSLLWGNSTKNNRDGWVGFAASTRTVPRGVCWFDTFQDRPLQTIGSQMAP